MIVLYPVALIFVSTSFFIACYFASPIFTAFDIDVVEITNAAFANIPVAVVLALVFMALGLTVIGDIVL